MLDNKNVEVTIHTSTSSSSNQFIPDNLELPDDTFRMSLDNFSMVGENVTIGRGMSVDSNVGGNAYTPTIELRSPLPTPDLQTPDIEIPEVQTADLNTPDIQTPDIETRDIETIDIDTPDLQTPDLNTPDVLVLTPYEDTPDLETPDLQIDTEACNEQTPDIQSPDIETPEIQSSEIESADAETPGIESPDVQTPPLENKSSPPIIETPKPFEAKTEVRRPQTLLKLSLSKKSDNDLFVKPSPVAELMSPARMLQFEVEATSATPTMKRAAIDFDFFSKHNFEEYFAEMKPKNEDKALEGPEDGSTYKETPVIVKADTVRHEIGYGK